MVSDVNAVAPAIDSFEHSVDGLEGNWMTTAAAAERTEGDQDANSENSFELILATLIQNLNDSEASDIDAYIHTVEADESSEFTIVVGVEQVAAIAEDGKFDTELSTIRQKHTTLENNDLTAWDTKETTVLPADDPLMVAYANDLKAQADLAAVNNFYGIAAQPLPSFDPLLLNQAGLMPFAMPFAANDFDYLNWGGSIAGIGPIAPSSFLQEIQESVQPSNQSFQPMTGINPLMPIPGPPQDFLDSLQQSYMSFLGGGTGGITTSSSDTVLPNAWYGSHPNHPSLADTMMPFYGDELPWQSEFKSGNFLSAALNGDMMGTETFIVRPSREPFESSVLLAFDSGSIFAPFAPFEFKEEEPRNWDLEFPRTSPDTSPLDEENDMLWPQLEPDDWEDLPERWNLEPKPWYKKLEEKIRDLPVRPKFHHKLPSPGHPGQQFYLGIEWIYG